MDRLVEPKPPSISSPFKRRRGYVSQTKVPKHAVSSADISEQRVSLLSKGANTVQASSAAVTRNRRIQRSPIYLTPSPSDLKEDSSRSGYLLFPVCPPKLPIWAQPPPEYQHPSFLPPLKEEGPLICCRIPPGCEEVEFLPPQSKAVPPHSLPRLLRAGGPASPPPSLLHHCL